MMRKALILLLSVVAGSCTSPGSNKAGMEQDGKIRLMTLDPGHFHAALVQKSMYPEVDSVVHVYAPDGPELKAHMDLIERYNSRPEEPTAWKEEIGSATCRERGCQYVSISGVAVSLKKKKK